MIEKKHPVQCSQQNRATTISCLVALVLLGFTSVSAQVRIIGFKLSTQLLPSADYSMPVGKDQHKKTGASSSQQYYSMGLAMQLASRVDSATGMARTWTGTFNGSYMHFSNKGYEAAVFPASLVSAEAGVQYYRGLNRKWGFLGLFSAGIYAEKNHISGEAIVVNVGGVFIRQYSPDFSLGFGLIVNNSFGTPLPWPAIFVNWQMGGRYKLNINLPDKGPGLAYNVSFMRSFSKMYDLGIAFKPRMLSYYVDNTPDNRHLLTYWELPIGIENRIHLNHIDLFANAGLVALRSVQYNEKKISQIFSDAPGHKLSAAPFLNLGLQWKF